MKLSVLIPLYNEKDTFKKLLAKVDEVELKDLEGNPIEKEIIIIDDCSTDGSREQLKELEGPYIKLFHEVNKGKGGAIKTGIESVTGDFVIFQDADLEYDPQDYQSLLNPLLEKTHDMVFGTRFVDQKFVLFGKNRTIHASHWFGNHGSTVIFNLLYGTKLTDVWPCYKLFRTDVLKSVSVESNRFEYDIELMTKLLRKGNTVTQLPIKYIPRSFEEGKKINWKDGIYSAWIMVKFRFKRLDS